jgi:hypothetical protein
MTIKTETAMSDLLDLADAPPSIFPSGADALEAWYNDPVYYDDMLVTRSTAFELCLDEHRGWEMMAIIQKLEPTTPSSFDHLMSAAEAFTYTCQRPAPANVTRDI